MSYFTDDLGPLAWLLEPPAPSEIDAQGLFSRAAIAAVEQDLLREAEVRAAGFVLPDGLRPAICYDERWRLASGLQKAIRAGDLDATTSAAFGLWTVDRAYLVRRLGIVAVEDVLGGSPLFTAITLAMIGNATWRAQQDEVRFLVWLARMLASVPKDRSAPELLERVTEDQTLDLSCVASKSDAELRAVAADDTRQLVDRMVTAWLLVGNRFAVETFPKDDTGRVPASLFQLMVDTGTSRWGLYTAAQTASRLRDAMWVSLLFVDQWLRESTTVQIERGASIPRPLIAGLLSPTFDMHTREGLRAMATFYRKCGDLRPHLDAMLPSKTKYGRGEGLFLAEGSVAEQRISYGESEYVFRWKRSPSSLYWLPAELATTYVPTLRGHLDELNAIRGQVVANERSR